MPVRHDQDMTRRASVLRQWWLWATVAFAGLALGVLGGIFVVWINGAADDPVINWIGEWIKTPGFAGLCAVVAAGIAFIGISLQLRASRARDSDAAWWQSFEWASDRGLPRDKTELELPSDAAIDTLNALATAARTNIQKNAVRGVVDELVRKKTHRLVDERRAAHGAEATEASPSTMDVGDESTTADNDDTQSDGFSSAVWRYALDQVGTAAESRRAGSSAYETEVLRALRHLYQRVLPMPANRPGDAIVATAHRELVVEIKWSPNKLRGVHEKRRLDSVDVVISNAPTTDLPESVNLVVWNPQDGSFALRRALEAIE